MTVVDVGANQGFYTLLAARCVRSAGQVFAFEPAPSEFAKLKRNVRVNRCSNVHLEEAAVGSSNGYTEFHVCLDGRGSFSSRKPPAGDVSGVRQQCIRVPLVSLDQYLADRQVGSVEFVKIDAEGGELEVLKGMVRILTACRPLILCELADIRTRPWGYTPVEIYRLLVEHGYQWYRTTPRGALVPAEPRESDAPACDNLVAVPYDRKEQIFSPFRERRC